MLAVYVIINANLFIQLELDSFTQSEQISEEMLQKLSFLLENGKLVTITIVLYNLQILFHLYGIFLAFKNQVLKKKGLMIAINLYTLFTSVIVFSFLLSMINIIVLICLKRKNPEDFPQKEMLPLPSFADKPISSAGKLVGILLCVIYFSQVFVSKMLPENLSDNTIIAISIAYYVILFILGIIGMILIFSQHVLTFIKNGKAYFQHIIRIVGIMYFVYYTLTLLIFSLANVSTSVNQSSIEELPLWATALLAILFAPLIEEIIFRGLLRKCIKNNTEFIVVSAAIFGTLHIMYESNLIEALALAVPYTILGAFLAYIYVKTDNLSNNILVHALHNSIGVIVLLLTQIV